MNAWPIGIRIWLTCCLSWLVFSVLPAQSRIDNVGYLPEASTTNGWCILMPEKKAYHWRAGHWEQIDDEKYDSGEIVHRYALLYSRRTSVYELTGQVIAINVTMARGDDSVLVIRSAGAHLLLNALGDTIAYLQAGYCNYFGQADTVAAQKVYCAARPTSRLAAYQCDEVRNWGIVDARGVWLIPPIYDGPVDFRDGFANVIYYGEPHIINERGEFVD